MNAKAKGSRQEHRTMRLLEALGYRCTRSAASLGEWDVVAIGVTDVVLVQVKSTRGPRPAELEALKEFCVPPGVRKLVHVWRPRKRFPEVTEL
jgi:Holliday junction resolvase